MDATLAQSLIAWLAVGGAALFLGRRAWRTYRRARRPAGEAGGCATGCGCAEAPSERSTGPSR